MARSIRAGHFRVPYFKAASFRGEGFRISPRRGAELPIPAEWPDICGVVLARSGVVLAGSGVVLVRSGVVLVRGELIRDALVTWPVNFLSVSFFNLSLAVACFIHC